MTARGEYSSCCWLACRPRRFPRKESNTWDIKTNVLFAQGGSPAMFEIAASQSDKHVPHMPVIAALTEKYVA